MKLTNRVFCIIFFGGVPCRNVGSPEESKGKCCLKRLKYKLSQLGVFPVCYLWPFILSKEKYLSCDGEFYRLSLYRAMSVLKASSIRALTTDAESLKTRNPYFTACPWMCVDPAERDEHGTDAGRSEGEEGSPGVQSRPREHMVGHGDLGWASEPGPARTWVEFARSLVAAGSLSLQLALPGASGLTLK